jgi:hypothetical protein
LSYPLRADNIELTTTQTSNNNTIIITIKITIRINYQELIIVCAVGQKR